MCNVVVLDNPSQFNNPFQFEITFECIEDLPEDLEWKIIYVGSAESEEFDQVCDRNYYCMKCELNNLGLGYCLCRPRSRGTAHVRVPGNFLQFDSETLFLSLYFIENYFSFRQTRQTPRRFPWQTWWGSLWSSSPAATDQRVSLA